MASYIQNLRNLVRNKKIILIFTSAVIVAENGATLWQFRSDFSIWGLPGGSLELEENLLECVKREVKEETGLEVEPVRLIGIYSTPDFDVVYPNQDQVQQVTFCFETKIVGGKLQADQTETLRLGWFGSNQLPPTFPWYETMIGDYAKKVNFPFFQHGVCGKRTEDSNSENWLQAISEKQSVIAPAAAAFVLDEQGRVFLTRENGSSLWTLPGGLMQLGERLDQSAEIPIARNPDFPIKVDRLLAAVSRNNDFYPGLDKSHIQLIIVLFVGKLAPNQTAHHDPLTQGSSFFAPTNLPPVNKGTLELLEIGFYNTAHNIFSINDGKNTLFSQKIIA